MGTETEKGNRIFDWVDRNLNRNDPDKYIMECKFNSLLYTYIQLYDKIKQKYSFEIYEAGIRVWKFEGTSFKTNRQGQWEDFMSVVFKQFMKDRDYPMTVMNWFSDIEFIELD